MWGIINWVEVTTSSLVAPWSLLMSAYKRLSAWGWRLGAGVRDSAPGVDVSEARAAPRPIGHSASREPQGWWLQRRANVALEREVDAPGPGHGWVPSTQAGMVSTPPCSEGKAPGNSRGWEEFRVAGTPCLLGPVPGGCVGG